MTISAEGGLIDPTQVPDTEPAIPAMTMMGSASRTSRRHAPLIVVGAVAWLAVLVGAAILADLLPLHDYAVPAGPLRQPPGTQSVDLLGTDAIGRSELSRLIYGARQSLLVGVGAVLIGFVFGGLLGMLAGYFRGRVDAVTALFIDSTLAIPPLLLILAITVFLQPSLLTLVIALALLSLPTFARISRANTLTLAKREFVEAARALGASRKRIIFQEILPNVLLPLMSYAFLITAVVIVAEGTLSFLGLGLPPPRPSWGSMIGEGRNYLADSPHLIFVPAIALCLTVLSLNVIGDHARLRYEFRRSGA